MNLTKEKAREEITRQFEDLEETRQLKCWYVLRDDAYAVRKLITFFYVNGLLSKEENEEYKEESWRYYTLAVNKIIEEQKNENNNY